MIVILTLMIIKIREANKRLKKLDRLKSIFLASMSHELRTPLTTIIGFTSLLLKGWAGEINKEQEKQLNMILNSANHLHELINDVIDISKIEADKLNIKKERYKLGKRILLLYITNLSGHYKAARAIERSLNILDKDCQVFSFDLLKYLYPHSSKIINFL